MTFSMMIVILNEITTILQSAHFIQMQEIAPYTWILIFDRGKLLVCMKGSFRRFHLTDLHLKGKPVPLIRHLVGKFLIKIELANQDKILLLTFSNQEKLVFEMVPGGKILLTTEYAPPLLKFSHKVEPIAVTSKEIEQAALQEMEGQWKKKWQQKMQSQLELIKREIQEGSCWQSIFHNAELLQNYFFKLKKGMSSIEVEDWEKNNHTVQIILDPTLEPHEQIKTLFKKSRKLKKKKEIAEKRFQEIESQMQHPPPFSFQTYKNTEKKVKKHPYREFLTSAGLKIYVGKKDRDNDELTFRFAHGSDYWFHAANSPGSHVILKVKKGEAPDEESIRDALELALYFSKSRGLNEEVIMSQCKYLSKPKGAKPGLVQLSKHKKIVLMPCFERIKKILDLSKKNIHV